MYTLNTSACYGYTLDTSYMYTLDISNMYTLDTIPMHAVGLWLPRDLSHHGLHVVPFPFTWDLGGAGGWGAAQERRWKHWKTEQFWRIDVRPRASPLTAVMTASEKKT